MIHTVLKGVLMLALIHQAPMGWQYDASCCGERDCKPVPCHELVEDVGGAWLYIPTGNKFAAIQVAPSPDRHCHVCIGTIDKRSLCAFILQGS